MRVLIDTNILISASLSCEGTPYHAYVKAVTHPNHGIVCDQNIDELSPGIQPEIPSQNPGIYATLVSIHRLLL
jgi:predicted nucleic acid-binding protein